MSQSKDQEYFSDGLSEELLNLLAQIPQLRVIARTSSFAFKGKEVGVAEIAKTLNVAHVLEGSVRKSGDTLRITAQLIRTADSSHLWSETYDRQLTDVFKVQDEIAAAVVAQLKVKLLPAQQVTNPHRTANTEAYNQYLLGNQFFNRNSVEGYRFAVAAYQKAIALDPRLRRGVRRARVCGNVRVGLCSDGRRKRRGKTARAGGRGQVDRAGAGSCGRLRRARLAALDRHLGLDRWSGGFRKGAGTRAGQRRRPSGDTASCCSNLGRMSEAIAATRKAIELDPLSSAAWNNLGTEYFVDPDQYREAREALDRALAINPESSFANINLVTLELLEGHAQEALERVPPGRGSLEPDRRRDGRAHAGSCQGIAGGARRADREVRARFGLSDRRRSMPGAASRTRRSNGSSAPTCSTTAASVVIKSGPVAQVAVDRCAVRCDAEEAGSAAVGALSECDPTL